MIKYRVYYLRKDHLPDYTTEMESIYIGDKLNLGIDVWLSSTPANVIHAFKHPSNNYIPSIYPCICKTDRIPCVHENKIECIKQFILDNPKRVYFSFCVNFYEDGTEMFCVRSWKNENFENQFDELKLHTDNVKNIHRL